MIDVLFNYDFIIEIITEKSNIDVAEKIVSFYERKFDYMFTKTYYKTFEVRLYLDKFSLAEIVGLVDVVELLVKIIANILKFRIVSVRSNMNVKIVVDQELDDESINVFYSLFDSNVRDVATAYSLDVKPTFSVFGQNFKLANNLYISSYYYIESGYTSFSISLIFFRSINEDVTEFIRYIEFYRDTIVPAYITVVRNMIQFVQSIDLLK